MSKLKYEKDLASKIKTNPKLFWKYAKSKTKTQTINTIFKEDGELSTNDKKTVTSMNNCFASVFVKDGNITLPPFTPKTNVKLTNFIISEKNVEDAIKKVNPNKSSDPNQIHPALVCQTCDQIKQPLTTLFNKSLSENTIPKLWKTSNVTPIYKKCSKLHASNYRPISLTSVPFKIMQRIVRDQLLIHLNTNNLITKHQHGVRYGRSCATLLLEALEDWSQALDEGLNIYVIYLDFSKAFDKVSHPLLLHKLKNYGVEDKVYKWIEEFLKNLKQCVVINGTQSSYVPVTSGVPQGSVLGPILFLVYVNDMPEVIDCVIKMFADDTKLYSKISTEQDKLCLQDSINRIANWTDTWLMQLNIEKCKHMEIGNTTNNSEYNIPHQNNNITIQRVDNEKDMGVGIDKHLKFSAHIQASVSKANQIQGVIFRNFIFMKIFKTLFKTLLRPHLEYSSTI